MFVRFLGFTIEAPASFTVNDLMEDLSSLGKNSGNINGVGRFLFVDSNSNTDYYLGLIVTVKNQKKFCELQKSGTSFKIVVNNLKKNSNLMDFNFFVINKNSGIGLYQHQQFRA